MSVVVVSSTLYAAGDTLTNTRVLALPPRESCSSIVSLLFLKERGFEVDTGILGMP